MIALDTNVLVRYVVEDDTEQAARAAALIDDALERQEPMFVSHVVLCELVWVLRSAYSRSRSEITSLLHLILNAAQLRVEEKEVAHRALAAFRGGNGDFADYMIREHSEAAGCDRMATFDRALLAEPGFVEP